MYLIVQSLFFKALALALLSSFWQMGLIWMIVVSIPHLFNLTSSQKFNIALIGQLAGFLIFIVSLFYYFIHLNGVYIFNGNIFFAYESQKFLNEFTPFISLVYIVVLIYQLTQLFLGYNVTKRLRHHDLKKMPAAERIFVKHTTALLSLKKTVSIYLSSVIHCPLTLGFFKPVILVPLAAINHLTKEQMEAVLLHELAHIKRNDYLLNLIESFIDKIFFFNIFSKMMHDIIERERENACDDFVLQFRYNAFHYAEALLKLGKLHASKSFAMAASGKSEGMLVLRVKRLLNRNNQHKNYTIKSLVFFFFILMFSVSLTYFSSSRYNNIKINAATAQQFVNKIPVKNQEVALKPIVYINEKASISLSPLTAKSANKKFFKKNYSKLQTTVAANNVQAQDYLINVSHVPDSSKQSDYTEALSKNILLSADNYKKVLSYQNFKQLEAMLYATSKLITVTEDPSTKNSYKKLITISAIDAQGNNNIYKVIVELYQ